MLSVGSGLEVVRYPLKVPHMAGDAGPDSAEVCELVGATPGQNFMVTDKGGHADVLAPSIVGVDNCRSSTWVHGHRLEDMAAPHLNSHILFSELPNPSKIRDIGSTTSWPKRCPSLLQEDAVSSNSRKGRNTLLIRRAYTTRPSTTSGRCSRFSRNTP